MSGMSDGVIGGNESRRTHPAVGARPRSGLRAMVVEDETGLAGLIRSYLEHGGLEVSLVHDGQQALSTAREVDPDVVVLDLGLPGLDGVEVCRQLRTFSDAYVVMLTARSEEVDTLIGLSVGADDYMTKPFSPRELMARVQAMLRRPRGPGGVSRVPRRYARLRCPEDRSPRSRRVAGRGAGRTDPHRVRPARCPLRASTAGLQPPAADRGRLGSAWVGDEHLVDVHIGHLRRKLGDDATESRFVRTVRGVGYRMGTGR